MKQRQKQKKNILVIKHGALGDMILATAPFKAIREHHKGDNIVLLTTKPYRALMLDSPYFDEILVDSRPKFWQLGEVRKLLEVIRGRHWHMVYDLQTSQRSTSYYRLFRSPKPLFSGIARGCSHLHNTPHRATVHTTERHREQLEIAGIEYVPCPDISWLKSDISHILSRIRIGDKYRGYALFISGGSAHRPEKRWCIDEVVKLGNWLITEQRVRPVMVGTDAEKGLIEEICNGLADSVNLCNQTSFADLAELGRNALLAVGNDTGPMHIVAATGCSSYVMFSSASNPSLCAPIGEHVTVIREADLQKLSFERVKDILQKDMK